MNANSYVGDANVLKLDSSEDCTNLSLHRVNCTVLKGELYGMWIRSQ